MDNKRAFIIAETLQKACDGDIPSGNLEAYKVRFFIHSFVLVSWRRGKMNNVY